MLLHNASRPRGWEGWKELDASCVQALPRRNDPAGAAAAVMDAVERLTNWFRQPDHLFGLIVFVIYVSAAHALARWLVPGANMGTDVGVCLFPVLTALTVEKAKTYRSLSFVMWVVAGLAVSVAVGAACQSFGNEQQLVQ